MRATAAVRAATHLLTSLREINTPIRLVTASDLWTEDCKSCPREVFDCFLVELTLEEGSQRLTLRQSGFWCQLDGQQHRFQVCSRRVFNLEGSSARLIRWSFLYKSGASGGNWRRDLYVLSENVPLASAKTHVPAVIGQRRTRAYHNRTEQSSLKRMKISSLIN